MTASLRDYGGGLREPTPDDLRRGDVVEVDGDRYAVVASGGELTRLDAGGRGEHWLYYTDGVWWTTELPGCDDATVLLVERGGDSSE